jgi:hypothetical protein
LACQPKTKPVEKAESQVNQEQTDPQNFNQDRSREVRLHIGQMIDPSFSTEDGFSSLFNCYLVSNNGLIKKVADSVAMAAYLQVLDGAMDQRMPMFEVTTKEQVIWLVKEHDLWAHILLDTGSMTILDIQFPPGSGVLKLGEPKVQVFQEQFIGSVVNFSPENFELTPWDESPLKGDVQIDGISGATKICQASVDMLNHQLPLYKMFIEASKTESFSN